MQLLGCTESRRFSPPMHTHWHLPSRSRRTRRRMMGKALSGGTSAATRRVTRAWWYTGTLTTGVCTACPTRPPRVILTEATGSPDPLIELTNRLGRMTDWAALDAAEGINQLVPPGQEAIIAEVDRSIRNIRLRPAADDGCSGCNDTSITTTDCQIWCLTLRMRPKLSYRSRFMAVRCQVQIIRENYPSR